MVDPNLGARGSASCLTPRLAKHTAVFVGRLIPHKGLVFAVRALADPRARDWGLLVVGDGPERERCQLLARQLGVAERVRFAGRLPREDVGAVLRQADAMIAPSMYEGSGFAVAEAVTLGCPVVATRRGGPEVMVPVGRGVLVEPSQNLPGDLAAALAHIDGRHEPHGRWTAQRLPGFLEGIYAQASQASA